MFDRPELRKYIAIVWVLVFILLLTAYYYAVEPFKKEAVAEISLMEKSIAEGNWSLADSSHSKLKDNWKKYQILIQLNNLSPAVSRFEQKLAELQVLITHKDNSALQYIGTLKDTLKSITSISPTPEG